MDDDDLNRPSTGDRSGRGRSGRGRSRGRGASRGGRRASVRGTEELESETRQSQKPARRSGRGPRGAGRGRRNGGCASLPKKDPDDVNGSKDQAAENKGGTINDRENGTQSQRKPPQRAGRGRRGGGRGQNGGHASLPKKHPDHGNRNEDQTMKVEGQTGAQGKNKSNGQGGSKRSSPSRSDVNRAEAPAPVGRSSIRGKGGEGRGRRDQKPSASKRQGGGTTVEGEKAPFSPYWSYSDCLALYAAKDPLIVRGKLRVLPANEAKAFVTCDRGRFSRDVLIDTLLEQNRGLDGDAVFVELYPEEETASMAKLSSKMADTALADVSGEEEGPVLTWQDDGTQRRLWNPIVPIARLPDRPTKSNSEEKQRSGRVVLVVPPKETAGTQPSELKPADQSHLGRTPRRTIVGRLNRMRRNKADVYFLTPNNKSLPQFVCPSDFRVSVSNAESGESLYKAEYVYGTWKEVDRKPPCVNVQQMGRACNVEDETLALLVEFGVDHGDFPAPVLKDVETAVESGVILQSTDEIEWKPTESDYVGRRDFREERIFTIDPTTAKDLDDALHVKALPDGRVEIGVHIADVSHFVQSDTALDEEAMRRATTVYLVDRTVPMLPRPLCEVACSLNENVERLTFSCVWKMNMDGSLESPGKKSDDDIWYGRTVIKSCARLDYATAQNIIEGKVANGEASKDMDESLWPANRRPSGKHTIDQVAADVRLMNKVAQARRRLRFQSGAVALNGIKLAFQLDSDGETPILCAPYPIRDSNRLVEEFMLLANYLVAQRLITHAGGLALLRHHPPPLMDGIDKVVEVAKEGVGFEIDATSSRSLQVSLSRLGRECRDELVLQCVTQMLMTPMKPAEYMAAGEMEQELWRHFALHIPYYTHFTSPIRRYPDIIVHRLLQATIDGDEALQKFPMKQSEVQSVSSHCNDKKMASKKAQDRSDRVFLALYLRKKPLKSQLGVVLSVGEKTFTVFVPSIGASLMLFLDEHDEILTYEPNTVGNERRILLVRKNAVDLSAESGSPRWSSIDVRVFTKLRVSCHCKESPPIDVKVMLEGPWTRN